MPSPSPAPTVPSRLHALDGLRAVAALSVVVYHAWLYTLPTVTSSARETTGDYVMHELRLGLVLFFVLSGYLLYGPWVRTALTGGRRPSTRGYAIRRAARILPAYWVAIVGSFVLLWPNDGNPGVRLPPAEDLWRFGVFAQNYWTDTLLKLNAPTWTLAVEATFYLVLPLLGALAVFGRRAGVIAAPVLFLALGFAYNYVLSGRTGVAPPLSKVLPAYAPYFALGMLAAVAAHGRTFTRGAMWTLVAAGCVLVIGDALWAADNATRGSGARSLRIWRDVPAAAGFALVLLGVGAAVHPPRLLLTRFMVWVGELSYGVYLWHVPLLLVLRANGLLPLNTPGAVLVVLPLTLLVASASWRWIERPAQDWSRRVASRGSARRAAALDRASAAAAP